MRKGERTREHIVEQAAILFNQKGFTGASVSEVMEATGLQKGGIYRHFESKEQLAAEAFDHAVAVMAERFGDAVRNNVRTPDRLRAIVSVFHSLVSDPPVAGGCPVVNTAVESDDGNRVLRARARAAMDQLRGMIRTTVEKGVSRGELERDTDPERFSTVLISTIEGGVILSRLYEDPAHADHAAAQLERWIAELETR